MAQRYQTVDNLIGSRRLLVYTKKNEDEVLRSPIQPTKPMDVANGHRADDLNNFRKRVRLQPCKTETHPLILHSTFKASSQVIQAALLPSKMKSLKPEHKMGRVLPVFIPHSTRFISITDC
jgi:hypothetical protein